MSSCDTALSTELLIEYLRNSESICMEKEILVETVRIIPSILWFSLVAFIVYILRYTIKTDLLPRVSNFEVLGVKATFVKKELDRVASETNEMAIGSNESRSQVARRAERIKLLLKGSKVLLVNDIPSEMSYLINILNELNIRIFIATSTEEALSYFEKLSFDLVISDMRRGDKIDAGIDLLTKARNINVDVPVIFTVGEYHPERGLPPYAFGITNKIDELMNLIFDVIERQKG